MSKSPSNISAAPHPLLLQAHPWHGIASGPETPAVVNAFIEIVPTDVHKFEVDKLSGHLKIDRPQKYSNQCPCLYGFIPRTYCGIEIGDFCAKKTGRKKIAGDGDPIDICVLSERAPLRGGILLQAIPIGGLRMIDGNEADDKIIAVLSGDGVYGEWRDISDCPQNLVDRLQHYFLTYKDLPGVKKRRVEITHTYGRKEAHQVIKASERDYVYSYAKLDQEYRRLIDVE